MSAAHQIRPAFQLRDARDADAGDVAELCRRALLPVDVEDVDGLHRVLWHDPDSAPDLALVAHDTGVIVGGVFASMNHPQGEPISGNIKLLAVDPRRRRAGIGAALLAEIEPRLHRYGAAEIWTGGSQPNYWWPGIDTRYHTALALFTATGYQHDDDTVNMRVNITHGQATTPATMPHRRLATAEWPAFQQWMSTTWDDQWATELQAALNRSPISCHVAIEDGTYLGFAAYDTNRRGWFGPMGTTPAARGKGIGAALLLACLDDYRAAGRQECEIAWAGPQDFYRRTVGAEVSRTFLRLRKQLQQ